MIAALVIAVALPGPTHGSAPTSAVALAGPTHGSAPASQVVGADPRVRPEPAARILVMPFENVRRDGRIFWLGEASAVLLTDFLNALGAEAITRPQRLAAFDRLQVPPVAALSDATVIRIGQIVGASQIILGSLELDNETLIVRARSVAIETGRVRTDVTVRGPLPKLFETFEQIARQIAPSPRSTDELLRLQPPIAAFESYIKGVLAETPATAVNYLNAALKEHPSRSEERRVGKECRSRWSPYH